MNAITPSPGETSISCYPHEVPPFVGDALSARYETLHASLPFFSVWKSLENAGCYIAWRNGVPADILLFRRARRRLEVLNEMIGIDPAGLQRFAVYMFEHFPDVDIIRFDAIQADAARIGFPAQQYNAKDTFVIALPATPEAYLASLGKSTRANLRARINAAAKHLPTCAPAFLSNGDIGEDVIRCIVGFSERRINGKGVGLRHDVARILALARTCGFVTVLTIDGRICAGSINYRTGGSVFGDVTAHDPAYDRYGLGALCVYHTICESIRTGARLFYLGGGQFGFKERMLGKRLDMDALQIFRSRRALAANVHHAALAFLHGQVRRLKQALHARKGTRAVDAVFRAFHAMKNRKDA